MKRKIWIAEPRGAVELRGDGAAFQQRCPRWPLCWRQCWARAGDAPEGTSLSWSLAEKLLLPWFFCWQSAVPNLLVFWLPKGLLGGEATSKSCWQAVLPSKCFLINSLIFLSQLHPGNLWQGSFPPNSLTLRRVIHCSTMVKIMDALMLFDMYFMLKLMLSLMLWRLNSEKVIDSWAEKTSSKLLAVPGSSGCRCVLAVIPLADYPEPGGWSTTSGHVQHRETAKTQWFGRFFAFILKPPGFLRVTKCLYHIFFI